MTIRDDLNKQYNGKKLQEIESIATENMNNSIMHRQTFIMILYYLNFTSRYKENLAYAKESFETYINDVFMLRLNTFNAERWAFVKHKDASVKHGPGIISRIKRECGALAVKTVTKELDNAERKLKKPLSRSKKDTIILKHALPIKEKPYGAPKKVVEAKLETAQATIQTNNKLKSEKDEQIAKLKDTVVKLKAENARLQELVDKYEAKEKDFALAWGNVSEIVGSLPHVTA